MLIEAGSSALLLIDLQTKLAPAIDGGDACISRCRLLLAVARRLNVPMLATEHCPESVGPTVSELRNELAPSEIVGKRHFNGAAEEAFDRALGVHGKKTVLVGGMEAHVCVLQTVLGLLSCGYQPVVVADAVASRKPSSRDLAIQRMRHNGVEIVNAEMVMFEWLKTADNVAFKDILPMIKSGSAN